MHEPTVEDEGVMTKIEAELERNLRRYNQILESCVVPQKTRATKEASALLDNLIVKHRDIRPILAQEMVYDPPPYMR